MLELWGYTTVRVEREKRVERKKEGFQTFRTLGDLDVQRRADQCHEGGVEVDRVVVGHGEVHAEQPLRESTRASGEKN